MTRITYVPKRFTADTLSIIAAADEVIEDFQARGFDLTLRQVYYQFIARDLFPDSWVDARYNLKHGLAPHTKNTEKNYKRLGSILNDARLAGLISWDAIVDRTRAIRRRPTWSSPRSIIEASAASYRIDRWVGQKYRVEVWVEKDALVEVVRRPCEKFFVPFFSCRGYVSVSSLWRAAQRLLGYVENDQTPIVLHLADHDPSGIDMTHDLANRLEIFGLPGDVVQRIALTRSQVDELNPPPNPAKVTDSRARSYIATHGRDSWELDALPPEYMVDLIERVIRSLRDWDTWKERRDREKRERAALKKAAKEIKV